MGVSLVYQKSNAAGRKFLNIEIHRDCKQVENVFIRQKYGSKVQKTNEFLDYSAQKNVEKRLVLLLWKTGEVDALLIFDFLL